MRRAPIPSGDYPWAKQLEQDVYWMDRYGRRIRITRMSDRYLANALRFAMRACWGQAAKAMNFRVNGEMAQDAVDEIVADYLEYRVPLIEAIVEEQEWRAARPRWIEKILDRTRR